MTRRLSIAHMCFRCYLFYQGIFEPLSSKTNYFSKTQNKSNKQEIATGRIRKILKTTGGKLTHLTDPKRHPVNFVNRHENVHIV